jgi:sterol desaturase/sphingolipid hydroxylase (fatty acid hydroxylase superfamily)
MDLSPVIIAIPMYFTLMAIELVYESITRRRTYRLNDAITNISTGTLQQLTGTFLAVVKVGLYVLLYNQFSLFPLEQTWTTFAFAFVLWDLCYYWEHRLAHEISLFWGGHSVHHQSEDYNLSVALRQSSTSFIWGIPIYLPMALIGIHPNHFILAGGINLLYQFWIHTEHIKKLPRWFEWIMNTPSHHRVHHGRDPKYLDKNYAGVFIIWDRMFGTFKEEEERPHYGVTKPIKSWNPVYANFAHYIDLFGYVGKARSFGDALKILFKPPGWLPEYLGGFEQPPEVTDDYQKYNARTTLQMNGYILIQFLVALGLYAFFFFKNAEMEGAFKATYAVWIVLTTLMFGFLFEWNKVWLGLLEAIRLLAIPIGIIWIGYASSWIMGFAVLFALGSTLVFYRLFQKARNQRSEYLLSS